MERSEYNATVTGKIMVTPDLMILRVDTDEPRKEFEAGQNMLLGLYGFEKRSSNSEPEVVPADAEKLIKRPYSIASAKTETSQLEFYISQVKSGQLTSRLFNLNTGDRVFVGTAITGIFRLDETPDGSDIVMVATGTGIAPYISFLRSHIIERPESKMVVIQGAAHRWDLGYYSELTFLEKSFANFFYVPTLTDADERWDGHRMWIEELLKQDILQNEYNISPDPDRTHFFVSGKPDMVAHVSEWLVGYGYRRHHPDDPGELYIEEF
ncbi:ferredoxin--NADP reductase [Chlorobium ferrooxidans]|uniref:ferredoxin--NADP(+) reductase n=1 Tax=Chlorobium ferrooxidans DSM 13031 TaxID=377431 RepID=Q0YR95_9CHLB|nr:ferredoxin--NADP reductase [Chlorobium ferrooxidans]EAT58814.1 Oxidoreductase FAD/NAD(P)-binding:Oxidoreductase FAD-binding region [Chlorobium ferrooxidans DSM 13031]